MIDSIKKGFALSVKALKLFYVLAAVAIVTNVISIFIVPTVGADVKMSAGRSFLVTGWFIFLILILNAFIVGGALSYIKDLIKTGSASLSPFVNNAKKYFVKVLAVLSIVLVIGIIVQILLIFLTAVLPVALRWIIGIVIWLALICLFALSTYAVVGSDSGAIASIKKSVDLGIKNFVKVAGVFLIMFVVFIVLLIIAGIISSILLLIVRPVPPVISSLIMALVLTIWGLLLNISFMNLYLKLSEGNA